MWQDLRVYEATVKSFHLILNEIEGLLRVLSRGVCVLVIQSCLTLCNPKNCSPPGSSVHGILQARMLEWVAISFSKQRVTCSKQNLWYCWQTAGPSAQGREEQVESGSIVWRGWGTSLPRSGTCWAVETLRPLLRDAMWVEIPEKFTRRIHWIPRRPYQRLSIYPKHSYISRTCTLTINFWKCPKFTKWLLL